MNCLMTLQSQDMAEDDPHQESIIAVYMQVATCLGPNFEAYMPKVYPSILKALDIDVGISMTDATEAD